MSKWKKCAVVFLVMLFTGATVFFVWSGYRFHRQARMLDKAIAGIDSQLSELQDAIFSEKIEQIVVGCKTEQEKTIAVARWISGNIRNERTVGGDEFSFFAERKGLCGARARLFVKAMEKLYIKAHVFNMYNFGGVGGGHSCAEAFYNGKWHFFDVTYAGYFMKDGDVLSWEEITSDPENVLKYMVVFEDTMDRYTGIGELINNQYRMEHVYTRAAIENGTRASGAYREALKIFEVRIDSAGLPLRIGQIDGESDDVHNQGLERSLTENLESTLNTRRDFFHVAWRISNLVKGKKYMIIYHFLDPHKESLAYWAKATGADIISGATFSEKDPEIWRIEFTANESEANILCGYDSRKLYIGPKLDAVEIVAE